MMRSILNIFRRSKSQQSDTIEQDFDKGTTIIKGCMHPEQLDIARNYLDLFGSKYGMDSDKLAELRTLYNKQMKDING